MSLITRNAKEYQSVTAQLMSQNLPIVSCSFGIFCVLRHPNHFVLAGANNRNVIITYRFLAAPVQANRDFIYIDCMTVYFNCKYFPYYTRGLLECLLGISPSGRNPCRVNNLATYIQDRAKESDSRGVKKNKKLKKNSLLR